MLRSTTALILAALSLPAAAGPLRGPVEAQLDGVEAPPTAASLKALGDGVTAELLEIAQDPDATRTHRAKALHALGWFPTPDTRAVLERALDGDDPKLARRAVYALGNGWGDDALPALERGLLQGDVQLRMAAARSLANVGTSPARDVLQKRLAVEKDPSVRTAIEASLNAAKSGN